MTNSISSDLIFRVQEVLEDYAGKGKLVYYSDIEARIGEEIPFFLWHNILDPIDEELMALGKPDLTAIVISKETNYPPFFSQGGKARSVRFNPDKHLALWQREVALVFSTWKK